MVIFRLQIPSKTLFLSKENILSATVRHSDVGEELERKALPLTWIRKMGISYDIIDHASTTKDC
jgi:hypothetical protein